MSINLASSKNRNQASGFSLVSVMVALGIVGILASVFSTFASQSIKDAKVIRLMGEKEDLRRMILVSVDCTESLATLSGTSIQLKNKQGASALGSEKIANTNSFKINNWYVRVGSYNSSTGEIEIFVRHRSSSGEKKLFAQGAPFVCS